MGCICSHSPPSSSSSSSSPHSPVAPSPDSLPPPNKSPKGSKARSSVSPAIGIVEPKEVVVPKEKSKSNAARSRHRVGSLSASSDGPSSAVSDGRPHESNLAPYELVNAIKNRKLSSMGDDMGNSIARQLMMENGRGSMSGQRMAEGRTLIRQNTMGAIVQKGSGGEAPPARGDSLPLSKDPPVAAMSNPTDPLPLESLPPKSSTPIPRSASPIENFPPRSATPNRPPPTAQITPSLSNSNSPPSFTSVYSDSFFPSYRPLLESVWRHGYNNPSLVPLLFPKFPLIRMRILVSSQTGTAEGFGAELQHEIIHTFGKGLNIIVKTESDDAKDKKAIPPVPPIVECEMMDLNTFSPAAHLNPTGDPWLIFLTATHYDGDPPDSGVKFSEWIDSVTDETSREMSASASSSSNSHHTGGTPQKDRANSPPNAQFPVDPPSTSLATQGKKVPPSPSSPPLSAIITLRFIVFALGNSEYSHFCGFGKKVDAALRVLGLQPLDNITLGNSKDGGDIDADFNQWKKAFFQIVHTEILSKLKNMQRFAREMDPPTKKANEKVDMSNENNPLNEMNEKPRARREGSLMGVVEVEEHEHVSPRPLDVKTPLVGDVTPSGSPHHDTVVTAVLTSIPSPTVHVESNIESSIDNDATGVTVRADSEHNSMAVRRSTTTAQSIKLPTSLLESVKGPLVDTETVLPGTVPSDPSTSRREADKEGNRIHGDEDHPGSHLPFHQIESPNVLLDSISQRNPSPAARNSQTSNLPTIDVSELSPNSAEYSLYSPTSPPPLPDIPALNAFRSPLQGRRASIVLNSATLKEIDTQLTTSSSAPSSPTNQYLVGRCVVNREQRAPNEEGRSTRHLEFELMTKDELKQRSGGNKETQVRRSRLPAAECLYTTGDSLGVYPRNNTIDCLKLIEHFGLNPNSVIRVTYRNMETQTEHTDGTGTPIPPPSPMRSQQSESVSSSTPSLSPSPPTPTGTQSASFCVLTILDLFTCWFDIFSRVLFVHVARLIPHIADEKEREEFSTRLSTQLGKDKFHSLKLNFMDFFLVYTRTCNPPLTTLLSVFPRLAPRFYTISSSSLLTASTCKDNVMTCNVTVSCIKNFSVFRNGSIDGVCSSYLKRLKSAEDNGEGEVVRCFIKKTTTRFPMKVWISHIVDGQSVEHTPSQQTPPEGGPLSPTSAAAASPHEPAATSAVNRTVSSIVSFFRQKAAASDGEVKSDSKESPPEETKPSNGNSEAVGPLIIRTQSVLHSPDVSPLSPTTRIPPQLHPPPIVMISVGSGIAPFRAFVQELVYYNSLHLPLFPSYLFFGCQNPSVDWLYHEEMEAAKTNGVLQGYYVAFSRIDGERGRGKNAPRSNPIDQSVNLDGKGSPTAPSPRANSKGFNFNVSAVNDSSAGSPVMKSSNIASPLNVSSQSLPPLSPSAPSASKDRPTAKSSPSPTSKSRNQYVQDILMEQSSLLFDTLVRRAGYLFVCGGVKMGAQVRSVVVETLLQQYRSSGASGASKDLWSYKEPLVTREDGEAYLKFLKKEKRFTQELWS